MKRLIKIFFLFQFSFFLSKAQHPYFASLNQQLLSLNPAFAGSSGDLRLQSYYANIWPNLSGYRTNYYIGANMLLSKRHGIGINAHTMNSYSGALRESQVSLSYAYHFTIKNKLKIVPAFQASFFQITRDFNRWPYSTFGFYPFMYQNSSTYYPSPYPPPSGIQSKYNFDCSAGLLVYKKNYYAGLSVLSLTQPDQGLVGISKRPATLIIQEGYRFEIGPKSSINTYGFFMNQSKFISMQFGAYFGYDKFKLHLAYKSQDAFVAGFNYTYKGLRAGYNYSVVVSKLTGNTAGTHDFYLSMNFGPTKKESVEKTEETIKLID